MLPEVGAAAIAWGRIGKQVLYAALSGLSYPILSCLIRCIWQPLRLLARLLALLTDTAE